MSGMWIHSGRGNNNFVGRNTPHLSHRKLSNTELVNLAKNCSPKVRLKFSARNAKLQLVSKFIQNVQFTIQFTLPCV